jgi:hypothetical protein
MRPHNWEKFSFGPWLTEAATRLHRNKLATALANKLARIAWSVLAMSHPGNMPAGPGAPPARTAFRFG